MTVSERLKALGYILRRPVPGGEYTPAVISRKLVYTAGMTPKINGKLVYQGKVGCEVTLNEANKAAVICILNALGAIEFSIDDLDHIKQIIKITGFINADSNFTKHSQVLNSASKFIVEIFGRAGAHARTAIGVASLPGNAPIEIELVAELK